MKDPALLRDFFIPKAKEEPGLLTGFLYRKPNPPVYEKSLND
jgi:hypothetical protein